MTEKLIQFINACWLTRSLNFSGLPIWPKKVFPFLPYDRTGYNGFLCWISKLRLTNVSVVLDAGANHGDFSEAAAAIFPSAKVILFEPFQELHADLETRCHRHEGTWTLQKYALGAEESSGTLHFSPSHDAIGSLKGFSESYLAATENRDAIKTIPCQVRCLDNVVAEKQISRIDILKIDVEGSEFDLLAGAKNALDITEAIIIEVSTIRDPESDTNALLRLLTLLDELKFYPVAILPSLYDNARPWMPVEFNVLARRGPILE